MTSANERKQLMTAISSAIESPQMQEKLSNALPAHVTVDKFTRVSMMAIQNNDSLMEADRNSLYQACVQCATDGLLPDGREAALVPFGRQVQYMPMVGGILKMVRNSGDLKEISAHVARENDHFEYELGDEERIVHRPLLKGDRGDIICTYAIGKTKDGGVYREVVFEDQMMQIKNVSRSGSKGRGPWAEWPEEMRKKTAIRRLAKRLPMSTDLQQLIMRGDDSQFDDPDKDKQPAQPTGSGPTRLKEAMGLNGDEVSDAEFEEVELTPQQKAAQTRKVNAAKKRIEAGEAKPGDEELVNGPAEESENPAPPNVDDAELVDAERTL